MNNKCDYFKPCALAEKLKGWNYLQSFVEGYAAGASNAVRFFFGYQENIEVHDPRELPEGEYTEEYEGYWIGFNAALYSNLKSLRKSNKEWRAFLRKLYEPTETRAEGILFSAAKVKDAARQAGQAAPSSSENGQGRSNRLVIS